MQIEIELNVTLTPFLAKKVRDRLNEKTELVAFKVADRFSLRSKRTVDLDRTIDQATQDYLSSIESITALLEQASGIVRVGAFFSEGEAAAFSVSLSTTTIEMLAKHQFTIDVTCYPCS